MPKFLKDGEILKAVKEIIDGGNKCRLAVAYWGWGAAEKIGIGKAKGPRVDIICDPWSGACNKEQLLALAKNPKVRLRHLRDLHAKVYLTSKGAVIGSANASTKGLGKSDGQTINHEAAIKFGANEDRKDLSDWFESKWKLARRLTEKQIVKLPVLPKPPVASIKQPQRTVMEVMGTDRDWFRQNRVRLMAYDPDEASDAAVALYKKTADEVYDPATRKEYEDNYYYPIFEAVPGWKIDPSDIVICFAFDGKTKEVEFDGIWTLKDEDPRVEGTTKILFLDGHTAVEDLKFPRSEIAALRAKVKRYLKANNYKEDRYGDLIDMNLADFWESPLLDDPWLRKLDPMAKRRILNFAAKQMPKVESIFVGKIGEGQQPNFRLHFKSEPPKDYNGKTFKSGKFDELKGGIKNPKNLVELRQS
ncbi:MULTISPECIES: phospholipase D family protein [Microvirga]|uniref:phospholipase D family protein n=1 Tax=Microvirga TaxID=186650 RepID=UPI0021CA2C5F|nr:MULTISPECIES: phospholipase D family protein [unclassified Microvirga]